MIFIIFCRMWDHSYQHSVEVQGLKSDSTLLLELGFFETSNVVYRRGHITFN